MALRLFIPGLPSLIEIWQKRTATCSGTQPAIELGFTLPPLPEKDWRARALLPGLASHKRRRSVQKTKSLERDCPIHHERGHAWGESFA